VSDSSSAPPALHAGGRAIAGADGCKAGWIAAIGRPNAEPEVRVFASIAALLDSLPGDAIVAVDMPIGLPDFTHHGGRGPERVVRPLIGERQSSVFSIPSRAAVYAFTEPFTTIERWYEGHRIASEVARGTSDPPRGVSIQAFGIFSKIREIDGLLQARPELRPRVIESHPEVAFWRLNGGAAMRIPKKVQGLVNPAGMSERRELLMALGLPAAFASRLPPNGAYADDFLDACALLFVAARHARGETISFPDPPGLDSYGIPVAIRV
jgi:predicted RNase H-like nuclease